MTDPLIAFGPLIERLENARAARATEASSWASLGRDRPDQLGDFRLHRPIGRGGMGVVFEATQISLGRTVALKILPRNVFSESTSRIRFANEAQTIAALHHTNIVPVYGVGFDEGYHYFVMQRLHGESVDQRLATSGVFTPKEAADLAMQAAKALAHAHDQGVLHRDIKPSNLIVSDDGQLWVTDFGVAKNLASAAVTRDGDAVGTFRYMAPEQILGETDVRTDVYSLGLTMYEMISGKPAIGDESMADMMAGKRSLSIAPISKAHPSVPHDLAAIIQTAVAADASERYPSASALAKDLQRYLNGQPVSVRPLSTFKKLKRWAYRYPAVAALSTALIVALMTVATTMTIASIRLAESNREQAIARQQAEQTSSLAVEALGEVFEQFQATGHETSTEISSGVTLDPAVASVLEGLLPYYDRVARHLDDRQSGATGALRRQAFASLKTVAAIQMQLGQYEDAIRTLERSRQDVSKLTLTAEELAIARAQLELDQASCLEMIGEIEASDLLRRTTIEHLDTAALRSSSAARYELARVHFMRGRTLLPGMGPDLFPPPFAISGPASRRGPHPRQHGPETFQPIESVKQSITIAKSLLVSADVHPDSLDGQMQFKVQRLLAAALLELSRRRPPESLPESNSVPQESLNEVIDLLWTLCEQQPDHIGVQFELATALSDIDVFGPFGENMPRSDEQSLDALHEQTISRLREAESIFLDLCLRHPNVPSYSNGLLHTQFKLARLVERPHARHPNFSDIDTDATIDDSIRYYARTGIAVPDRERLTQAVELYRSAAQVQSRLVQRYPDSWAYRVWQALFLEHLAETQMELGFFDGAAKTCSRIEKIWKRVGDHHHYEPEQVEEFALRNEDRLKWVKKYPSTLLVPASDL
ncbi:serine/threonine protein kinase [Neorhodopirellula pilleata]|uniref:Serine/threonine-protein kinase PrkC n=1 Tax=Neorhodopirellula pilleata TaxID=2714738 RepID=A0A5C6AQU9_9BACT|nr:serine/threonine-protein kinase [Neorhodopirellula pilleata]TWU01938.1 Serine/threonine-protein kinase PrkC [Neorhodopirellula pilleata]